MTSEINPYQKLLEIMDQSLTASDESYLEENLKHLLSEIGTIFHCRRIVFYEKTDDGSFVRRYEWTNGSVSPSAAFYPASAARKYQQAWEKFSHQDIIEIGNIEELRDANPDLYQMLKEKGVRSVCFSILRTEDQMRGFLFIENPSWTDENAMFTILHIWHQIMQRSLQNKSRLSLAEKKGSIDELTGLGNRTALSLFLETLSHHESLGIVYADVNGLKAENDRHGHDAGDELLKKTADILTSAFGRKNVFRIGGDEFLAVQAGQNESAFTQCLKQMQKKKQEENIVIASGSVFEDPWQTDFEVLMRIADSRMYTEKKKWYSDQESRNIQASVDDDLELVMEIFVNQGLYQVLFRNSTEQNTLPDYGSLNDLIQTCVEKIIYPDDAGSFQRFFNPVMLKKRGLENDAGSAQMQKEFRISTADGTWNWIRMSLIVSNADDNDFRILAIARNLSRYNRTAMKYRRMENDAFDFRREAGSAIPDPDLLRKINLWMTRNAADKTAFLYFRMNHFTLYKTIFGAPKAGSVLDLFYRALRDCMKQHEGICGYYGGDEFLAAVPVPVSDDVFVKNMEGWLVHLSDQEGFRPSCGIAMNYQHESSISELYDRAMLSQDSIHNSTRKLVQLYSGDEFEQIRHETKMLEDFHRDMKNGTVTFYLQPKVNMENGRIVSAEALVRWIHQGRIIPPDQYIPLLEREEQIYPLDRYVWEKVFAYQKYLIAEGVQPLPISVNVSQKDILRGSVAEDFQGLCQKYGIEHRLVNIEITESAYAESGQVRQLSETLSRDGFTVLMDDFGKGYSSLAMFSSMPVDVLKIDKKFVDQILDDQKDAEVVSLIIRMAHMAGIHVVVEGVETEEQVNRMLSLNCHYAQGYYFYKPMPQDEYEELIRNKDNVQYDPNASSRLSVGRLDFTELVRSGFIGREETMQITGALSIWEIIDEHLVLLQMNDAYEQIMGTSFAHISPDHNFYDLMTVPEKDALASFHEARRLGSASVTYEYTRPDTHETEILAGTIYPMSENLNGDLYLVQIHRKNEPSS